MPESEELQRLNDRARELYNQGDYDGAKRLWEEVLKVSPDDPAATEGFRMVSILTEECSLFDSGSNGGDDIEGRADQIMTMLRSGQVEEAMSSVQALMAQHPDDPRVHEAHKAAQQAYESQPFIREQLDRARAVLADGKPEEAREHCRKVLAVDSGNLEAREQLLEIERCITQPKEKPASGAGGSGETVAFGLVFERREVGARAEEETATPVKRAPESPSGGLLEPGGDSEVLDLGADGLDLDLLDEEISNLGGGGPMGAAPETPTEAAPHPKPLDLAGPSYEPPAGTGMDGERDKEPAPDRSAHTALPRADSATMDAPPSHTPPPSETSPVDELQFDLDQPPPPQPSAAGPLTEEDLPEGAGADEFVKKARRELEAERYSDAIASASRAMAIAGDSNEASQIIDEARGALEREAQKLEHLMQEAHDAAEAGNTEAAEGFLRKVLDKSPEHQEALALKESLAKDSAEPSMESIPLVRVSTPPPSERVSGFGSPGEPAPSEEDSAPGGEPVTPLRQPPRRPMPTPLARPAARQAKRRFSMIRLLVVLVPIGLAAAGYFFVQAYFGSSGTEDVASADQASLDPEMIDLGQDGAGEGSAGTVKPDAAPSRPTPEAGKTTAQLVAEGRKALREGRTKDAVEALRRAAAADSGNVETLELLNEALAKLEAEEQIRIKMKAISESFEEHRYEDALRILYRLPEELQKGEIERYKRNAWFNIGVVDLRGMDCAGAIDKFTEALNIDSKDSDAIEARKIAESYQDRDKDIVYRTFVNKLGLRSMNSR
jgi:tetratricopeptide (TPR) repeat protein